MVHFKDYFVTFSSCAFLKTLRSLGIHTLYIIRVRVVEQDQDNLNTQHTGNKLVEIKVYQPTSGTPVTLTSYSSHDKLHSYISCYDVYVVKKKYVSLNRRPFCIFNEKTVQETENFGSFSKIRCRGKGASLCQVRQKFAMPYTNCKTLYELYISHIQNVDIFHAFLSVRFHTICKMYGRHEQISWWKGKSNLIS